MAINVKYSFKDFSGQDFGGLLADEFRDEIKGSCFAQEVAHGATIPDGGVRIFPAGMTGVTFTRCNLDNVYVPLGNTVSGSCAHRYVQAQNDREDWVLNKATKTPLKPINKKLFIKLGLSIDPIDIPNTKKVGKSVTQEKLDNLTGGVK